MSFLNDLTGGQGQQGFSDFIDRVQQGTGQAQQLPDEEVAQRYSQVAPNLSHEDFRDSAEQAFEQLNPQERQEFATWLQQRSQQQEVSPSMGGQQPSPAQLQDPGQLASYTSQLRQQNPGILEQLMGKGGTGGTFDNPIAKAAFAGIAAMAAQRLMNRR